MTKSRSTGAVRRLHEEVLPFLPPRWRGLLQRLPADVLEHVCELRLRVGRPVSIVLRGHRSYFVGTRGVVGEAAAGEPFSRADGEQFLQLTSRSSLYTLEEQFRHGFLTLPGGHRVGFCGQTILAAGTPRLVAHVGAFNVRIAQAVPGAADAVLPHIVGRDGRVRDTLIVSPPGGGKTTLLRDVARVLSCGAPAFGLPGCNVSIVDERSEIAACHDGVPTHDVGPRTDVADACPKATGIMQMIRTMGPDVIVTDEIGRPEDVTALSEALHAGVSVVASAHGASWEQVARRPALAPLVKGELFDTVVVLSPRPAPGTVKAVLHPDRQRQATHTRRSSVVQMS